MAHSAKYIIRADIRTSGVVERSDVVGAIYGQTEGLLGDELDLRELQESSKVGRIDVDVDSEGGRSFGVVTIETALTRAETAVLAAALETIERVGPSRAECTVSEIVDARAAKRREIVDRATELLAEFEEQALTSDQLVDEVQQRAREEEITDYHGLPAGPLVADTDAVIVVEGRADVRKLLSHGIRNAVAVEGTDIPDPVARLTTEQTTTAFLDGDRGGDLILRELTQVGDVDYVAFAPSGTSVEDLDRAELLAALRKKLPHEQVAEATTAREAFAPTDGGTVTEQTSDEGATATEQTSDDGGETSSVDGVELAREESAGQKTADLDDEEPEHSGSAPAGPGATESSGPEEQRSASASETPPTLGEHVEATMDTGSARLLDDDLAVMAEPSAEATFDAVADAEPVPQTVVLDGTVTQRLLDVAAQRGVGQLVGTATGDFVKQPTAVRVHTVAELDLT